MFIFKKHLPRRTFLKGAGATLALPLLDAMVPASTALAQTPARRIPRLNIVYIAHGMVMQEFTPAATGRDYETTVLLRPLARHRESTVVVSGLGHHNADADGAGHAPAAGAYLTGAKPKRTEAEDARAGISIDQVAAQAFGQETLFPSLELATEDFTGLVGACDVNYSCTYINTLSWSSPTTPLPNEINPRILFERFVGEGGTPEQRLARLREDRSILDSVLDSLTGLRGQLGTSDRATLEQYVTDVREIERRLQIAERRNANNPDLPLNAPVGVPDDYAEHIALMFDLQALAFQTDLTRVITFILARELTGRGYPDLGVPEPNHSLSHHNNDPEALAKLAKVQAYHMSFLANFLDKLEATADGDGTLLDNMLITYGSCMSDSSRHYHHDLPMILAGHAGGTLEGGRHVLYPDTPMCNLFVSMMDKLGSPVESFGDSTGRLSDL